MPPPESPPDPATPVLGWGARLPDASATTRLGVRWLGHATVCVELDGVRLLTDPVLRARVGPLRRHAPDVQPAWYAGVDAVLISHLHHDHLDLPSLGLLGPGLPVVVPRGAGRWLRRHGFPRVHELGVGEVVEVGAVRVTAVPAAHEGLRRPLGPLAEAVGYVVRGSARVYFAGDTDLFGEMAGLGAPLDVALLPVGGWGPTLGPGHLDPWRAAEALRLLRPRVVVPIHWGTLWPAGLGPLRGAAFHAPARLFARYAADRAPNTAVLVLAAGEASELAWRSSDRSAQEPA